MSGSGTTSESASSSSVSFTGCYSTSLNSTLHSTAKAAAVVTEDTLSSFEKNLNLTRHYQVNMNNKLVRVKKKRYSKFATSGVEKKIQSKGRLENRDSPLKIVQYYSVGENLEAFDLHRTNTSSEASNDHYEFINENQTSEYAKPAILNYQQPEYLLPFTPDLNNFMLAGDEQNLAYQIFTIPNLKPHKDTLDNLSHEQTANSEVNGADSLENYYCYFSYSNNLGGQFANYENNVNIKMFPRTNPFCRNINYYVCKALKNKDSQNELNYCSKL